MSVGHIHNEAMPTRRVVSGRNNLPVPVHGARSRCTVNGARWAELATGADDDQLCPTADRAGDC